MNVQFKFLSFSDVQFRSLNTVSNKQIIKYCLDFKILNIHSIFIHIENIRTHSRKYII